ncbi:hypothetical protein D9757_013879 [Collybiopsis confluens]|uniref:Xylanolytic transcriptional activator regulatory domain-containing protein n=1 Tax=Collybiopsis confluens TaxID=2823264 RepID=A0A8H5FPH7_9AGAR|nr:hypothetical protein D9757_013879 [Collybiopsis confluens]
MLSSFRSVGRDWGKTVLPIGIGLILILPSIQEIVDKILSSRRAFQIPEEQSKVREMLVDLANHIKDLENEIRDLQNLVSLFQPTGVQINRKDLENISASQSGHPRDDYSLEILTKDLKSLEFDAKNARHFGASSNLTLMNTAMGAKKSYTGGSGIRARRRPEFWTVYPKWQWQKDLAHHRPPLEFPPDDLMQNFINLYFTQFNHILPIIHRTFFLKSVEEKQHLQNRHFGELLLAVCTMGARFSDDPRVLEHPSAAEAESSAGWKWIKQIQPLSRSFIDPPSVYEVQMLAVYITFIGSTSTPEICWILIGVGVRLLQDVGAHRKRRMGSTPASEIEFWIDAFWLLYAMDIFATAFLGRPSSIQNSSFDLDPPLDCDEEFWEHLDSVLQFKHPSGEPSRRSYWVCFIKLMIILKRVLSTIYPVNPSNHWSTKGMSKLEWSEQVVAELDSALNEWSEEIPVHLKWDPNRQNREHFEQSVMLYTNYYLTQILVHRVFIPEPGAKPILNFPSLEICANAARLCLHVLEIHHERGSNLLIFPQTMMALFNSTLILLVNAWRNRRSSISWNSSHGAELALIHKSIDILHHTEHRWLARGRFADILMEVVSVSHLEHELNRSRSTLKRTRYVEDDLILAEITLEDESLGPRKLAGSRRVASAVDVGRISTVLPPVDAEQISTALPPPSPTTLDLPLYSSELGSVQSVSELFEPDPFGRPWLPSNLDQRNPRHSSSLSTSGDFLAEHPPPDVNTETTSQAFPDDISSAAIDSEDWVSYMAAVDEVLRSMDSRA